MNTPLYLIESPISMIEGEAISFSVDWLGASRVENPSLTVYKNGEDITSAALISGDAHSVSGNVLTLKKLTAGAQDGGTRYILAIAADVDSNHEVRKLLVDVLRADDA